ncbi:MAG: hypothetical protein QM612_07105 [Thermomonas sp.]|uniref:energy transducer TonB n=1 Tax=Thermomonas sp. TaxID=1971895 RepID=UPI0039E3DE67
MRTVLGFALALSMLPALSAAQEKEPSTIRDYSLNANRDLPIRCWKGQLARAPGKTMGELFGDAWPAQPEPAAPDAHSRARLKSLRVGREKLRGLPMQSGLVVAAVLVDAEGKALKVEPLCATTEGFDMAVKRIYLRAEYVPATVNGKPVTSVAGIIQRFDCAQNEGCRIATRADAPGDR